MAYIYVNRGRLQGFGNTAKQIAGKVESIRRDLYNVGSRLDWDIKSASNIDATISQINNEIERYIQVLNKMYGFFAMAYTEYNKLDTETLSRTGKIIEHTTVTIQNKGVVESVLSWFGILSDSTVGKIVKDMGGFGSVSFMVTKLISSFGRDSTYFDILSMAGAKNYITLVKDVKSGFEKLIDLNNDLKRIGNLPTNQRPLAEYGMWKRFVGSKKYITNPSKASSFFTRLDRNFRNAFSKEIDGFMHFGEKGVAGVKSAWKIGGVALAGIVNGFSNYEEYKSGKVSGERAITETILETGIDVVKGAALIAGVGAVAAAATVSAPAWAVAGVAAGVGIGIDYTFTKITSKSSTEWASDLIIDTIEWKDKFVNIVVSSGFNFAGNTIASWRKGFGY